MYSTKPKTQYRHPLKSTSTWICHLCKKPWTPITIPIKNKYINLHDLLQSKGYITGLEQNNPFLAVTVDRTSNGPLRTNSSITSPPNTKSQKNPLYERLYIRHLLILQLILLLIRHVMKETVAIQKTTLAIQQVMSLVNLYRSTYICIWKFLYETILFLYINITSTTYNNNYIIFYIISHSLCL